MIRRAPKPQRRTRQRAALERVIGDADRPLSPAEILKLGRRHAPGLGIATVYRTLQAMLAENRIAAVTLPDEAPLYEAATRDHHHHFRCRLCRCVFPIHGCPEGINRMVPKGFQVDGHEVVLYGRCPKCA